ncbi:MAG TPA: hypothetical protein V6D22_25045 [Candidatus Obscuribacterales bacterium]
MLKDFHNFDNAEETDQVKALRRLACMYHAAGNYDKAEELLEIAEQWHSLNRSHDGDTRFRQRRRDEAA